MINVANDFTQVIHGIGCWITNLGRAELVSEPYYGHIGYLAENGGKIRATNGNSSYGDFGTVAEGVDSTEVPITAFVDNRSTDALVDPVNQQMVHKYLQCNMQTQVENIPMQHLQYPGDGFGLNGVAATYNTGGVYEIRLGETPASHQILVVTDMLQQLTRHKMVTQHKLL